MKKVTIIILSCLLCLTSQSKPKPIFSESDHCVAWKARKVIALVKTVEPIGKNCKITTELKGSRDSFRFLADFPVKNFDSNEPDRDKEVTKILKANDTPQSALNPRGCQPTSGIRFSKKNQPQSQEHLRLLEGLA